MARILVVEPVAQPALELLADAHETEVRTGPAREIVLQLLGEGGGWDALVVRSQTRVDAELPRGGRSTPQRDRAVMVATSDSRP